MSIEEWMWRGLAIAMCLAMVGLAVMPMAVGDIAAYCYETSHNSLARVAFMTEFGIGGAELGYMMASAAFTGPVGWVAGALVVTAMF